MNRKKTAFTIAMKQDGRERYKTIKRTNGNQNNYDVNEKIQQRYSSMSSTSDMRVCKQASVMPVGLLEVSRE